jgi:cytochrome c oxidase subunit 2
MRTRIVVASFVCLLTLVGAGCGGGGGGEEEAGTQPTTTAAAGGGAENGKQIFIAQGCGGCHALSTAGTNGTTGPDLDEALKGKDAAFIRKSIVDPDAQITEGFQAGLMPKDYGEKLSDQDLSDLVAFLLQSA